VTVVSIFRTDPTNVGDWYCNPGRYLDFFGSTRDIVALEADQLSGHAVVVGGGGLISETFRPHMERLAEGRPRLKSLVAWGIGESLNVDRKGGFVLPYAGPLPAYLDCFDLVGLRDYGTRHCWAPCASCLLPYFDVVASPTRDIVIYEHKRIPIPIEGIPRRTNDGNDIEGVLAFLASAEVVITNSYHGAYWATLLGRRVFAIPNMSKMYRFKHPPVIGRAENWKRLVELTVVYPQALSECRAATNDFHAAVRKLIKA
jgi:hypothetical protein